MGSRPGICWNISIKESPNGEPNSSRVGHIWRVYLLLLAARPGWLLFEICQDLSVSTNQTAQGNQLNTTSMDLKTPYLRISL